MFIYYLHDMCWNTTTDRQRLKLNTWIDNIPCVCVGFCRRNQVRCIGSIVRWLKLPNPKTDCRLIGCQFFVSTTPVASPCPYGSHVESVDTPRLLQITIHRSHHQPIPYVLFISPFFFRFALFSSMYIIFLPINTSDGHIFLSTAISVANETMTWPLWTWNLVIGVQ